MPAIAIEVARLTEEVAQLRRELSRNERLAELGRVAVHVAQEAQSQLTTVGLYHKLLRRRVSDDAGSLDVLAKIEHGLADLKATVEDLLQFNAESVVRPERVRVRQLVDDIHATFAPQLAAQAIRLEVDVAPGKTVFADCEMLRRGIANLLRNALEAMPDGGELVITSYSGPSGFELEIADSGPGIDAEVRRRAFEPFYSTKPGAAGLGLAIVARIVAAHGGQVIAQNCPEGGAAFTLRFPRRALEAAA